LISLRIPAHVLTNPQFWIIHPLPLGGLTCLQPVIAASLAVPWDSSNFFPLIASIEFPNVRETEKGLKPPLVLSWCDSFFSLRDYYLLNPNGEGVQSWITNRISKFYENPTVNETGIVVLLRPFWISAGKKKATMRKVFLSAQTWYWNSQRRECSKLGCKYGAQISRRSNGERVRDCCFSETCLMGCGKKKEFWVEKREKRKWGKEEAPDLT